MERRRPSKSTTRIDTLLTKLCRNANPLPKKNHDFVSNLHVNEVELRIEIKTSAELEERIEEMTSRFQEEIRTLREQTRHLGH